ncbi:MAG: hypothetical protein ACKVVP_08215 [Chloroflexota bacterium]
MRDEQCGSDSAALITHHSSPITRLMRYNTPIIVFMAVMMLIIGFLAGVEPWMLGAATVVALVMYFVERRKL